MAILIHGQQLTVAWLGDSQAMLVRKGQVVTLMEPHKPEREVHVLLILPALFPAMPTNDTGIIEWN